MLSIDQLIDIVLKKSEELEEELKNQSHLKNLTVNQLHCIEVIIQKQNPSLTEIADELKITKASASVMVDRLVKHGYLKKVQSDEDRRSAHIHLTAKGKQASELHEKVHKEFAKKLTNNLTESETGILVVLLNKAIKSL